MPSPLRSRLEALLSTQPGSPELAGALALVDAAHRRGRRDRRALRHALALLDHLLRRGERSPRRARPAAARLARHAVGLFQEAPFAALLCDARLAVLSLNRAAEALFGFGGAEAEGKDLA